MGIPQFNSLRSNLVVECQTRGMRQAKTVFLVAKNPSRKASGHARVG